MAAVEAGREVEVDEDRGNASKWEKLVSTAALRLIEEELRDSQERNARGNGSTNEDVEAAGNLLNLPRRAKAVEEEELAIAQKRGWRRG